MLLFWPMEVIKKITFFLTAPIIYPIMLFAYFTYGHDTDGHGWYQELWESDSIFDRALAILLAPIYFPLKGFLNFAYPLWAGLVDD